MIFNKSSLPPSRMLRIAKEMQTIPPSPCAGVSLHIDCTFPTDTAEKQTFLLCMSSEGAAR